MRRGECLVQVDVHHVEAHVAGTAFAEQRIEVRTVVVHQAACLVHHLGNLQNTRLEDAQRIGIGHHHGSDLASHLAEELTQVVNIDCAVSQALHLDDFQAADCRGGWVRAVCRVGNKHLCADVALAFVICTDDHQAGQLAVCSGTGIQREFAQSGKFGKRLLQVVVHFQCALAGHGGLQGMQSGEGLHAGYLFVDDGIVLHRA